MPWCLWPSLQGIADAVPFELELFVGDVQGPPHLAKLHLIQHRQPVLPAPRLPKKNGNSTILDVFNWLPSTFNFRGMGFMLFHQKVILNGKWKKIKKKIIRKIYTTFHSKSSRQQMSTITIYCFVQDTRIAFTKITPQFAVQTSNVDPN